MLTNPGHASEYFEFKADNRRFVGKGKFHDTDLGGQGHHRHQSVLVSEDNAVGIAEGAVDRVVARVEYALFALGVVVGTEYVLLIGDVYAVMGAVEVVVVAIVYRLVERAYPIVAIGIKLVDKNRGRPDNRKEHGNCNPCRLFFHDESNRKFVF